MCTWERDLYNHVLFYLVFKPSQHWLSESRVWHDSCSVHRETCLLQKIIRLHGLISLWGVSLPSYISKPIKDNLFNYPRSELLYTFLGKQCVSELEFPSLPNSLLSCFSPPQLGLWVIQWPFAELRTWLPDYILINNHCNLFTHSRLNSFKQVYHIL